MTVEIERLIEQNDLKLSTKETSALILNMLSDFDTAYQFVMVELDMARQGCPVSRRFVEATAIPRVDYENALYSSDEATVGPNGPMQMLSSICGVLNLHDEPAAVLRLAVINQVMEQFRIGPYMLSNSFLKKMPMESIMNYIDEGTESLVDYVQKRENSHLGMFVNIMNDLADYSESCDGDPPKVLMAYAYARRAVSAGLYIQGVLDRKEYAYQEQTFRNFQQKLALENESCQSKEFQTASNDEAVRFLLSYDNRLTLETVGYLVGSVLSIVPNNEALCPKDNGMLITPDGVFAWLEETVKQSSGSRK